MNEQSEYDREREINNARMAQLLQQMFPNLRLPYEYVYEMLLFLDDTKVNAQVLPRVIRGVNNILIGTGKGQVIVHVLKETMNVSVREQDEEMKVKT